MSTTKTATTTPPTFAQYREAARNAVCRKFADVPGIVHLLDGAESTIHIAYNFGLPVNKFHAAFAQACVRQMAENSLKAAMEKEFVSDDGRNTYNNPMFVERLRTIGYLNGDVAAIRQAVDAVPVKGGLQTGVSAYIRTK